MAHFSTPSIHTVDKITAQYSPQGNCIDLILVGECPFMGHEDVKLSIFFGRGDETYAERLAAAINGVRPKRVAGDAGAEQ